MADDSFIPDDPDIPDGEDIEGPPLSNQHEADATPFGYGSEMGDENFDLTGTAEIDEEEIARSQFSQLPPGEYNVQVLDVRWHGGAKTNRNTPVEERRRPVTTTCYVPINGVAEYCEFGSRRVQVTLAKEGADWRCQSAIFFTLPPDGRRERFYYENCFSKKEQCEDYINKKGTLRPGQDAKKLTFFLKRLGFEQGEDGRFEAAAGSFANWIFYPVDVPVRPHRLVRVKVRKAKEGKQWNEVDVFSMSRVPIPEEVAVLIKQQAAAAREAAEVPTEPTPEAAVEAPASSRRGRRNAV